jgi:hypothetical protein
MNFTEPEPKERRACAWANRPQARNGPGPPNRRHTTEPRPRRSRVWRFRPYGSNGGPDLTGAARVCPLYLRDPATCILGHEGVRRMEPGPRRGVARRSHLWL